MVGGSWVESRCGVVSLGRTYLLPPPPLFLEAAFCNQIDARARLCLFVGVKRTSLKNSPRTAVVKGCGWRPHDGGAAHTGAGGRKPPMEETAGGADRSGVRRYGDFVAGGPLSKCIDRKFWK